MQDARCRIQDARCIPHGRVFRRQVPGTGFRVSGTRHLEPGTRHLSGFDAEDRVRLLENASIGFASYIPHGRVFRSVRQRFRLIARSPYCAPGTWDLVPGTGTGSTPKAGYRAPRTEPEQAYLAQWPDCPIALRPVGYSNTGGTRLSLQGPGRPPQEALGVIDAELP
jgi:hypothetical protein